MAIDCRESRANLKTYERYEWYVKKIIIKKKQKKKTIKKENVSAKVKGMYANDIFSKDRLQ